MYRILIFYCLWHLSLSEQNFVDIETLEKIQFITNGNNVTLSRPPRARTRFEKPVDCKKLHGTDDSAFVAIILNKISGRLLGMGSIIDERHILTSNKAVHNVETKHLRVLLGYFKAYWGRHSYVFYVEKVLKHEHDLVILRLTKIIIFSRTIKPIRLLRLKDNITASSPPASTILKADSQEFNISSFMVPKKDNSSNENVPASDILGKILPKQHDESREGSEDKNQHFEMERTHNKTIEQNNLDEENNETNSDEVNDKKNAFREKQRDETDSGGKEVEDTNVKIYRSKGKNRKKISKRQEPVKPDTLEPAMNRQTATPSPKHFSIIHSGITKVRLVGFPVSHFELVGDPISQSLVYGMREESVQKTDIPPPPAAAAAAKQQSTANDGQKFKDCIKLYEDKPSLDPEDTEVYNRYFCTDGTSKFCWGCVGGPTLFKKEQEYIQVGVVGGANCEKETNPYIHIRVDEHIKWIEANSLIVPKV